MIFTKVLHNSSISYLYHLSNRLRKFSIIKKGDTEMRKHLKWWIAAIVAGLLVMAIAIPVFAAGPNGANSGTPTPTIQPGYGNGNCQGSGAGINEAVTNLLGMTQEQIQEQRQSGKSLAQIAAVQGVSEEALINAIMAGKQEAVQNMVTAGTITQTQADQMFTQMRERVQLAVNRTTVGPPEWAGTGRGGQMGNQQNFNGTTGTCTGQGTMMRAGRGISR
jgi:hypothetical protein